MVKINKKIHIPIIIVGLIIISQWAMVRMVYAHKLSGPTAEFVSRLYNLKAGSMVSDDGVIDIYLEDFFKNKIAVGKFIDLNTNGQLVEIPTEAEVDDMIWDKMVMDAWVEDVAKQKNIEVTEEDLTAYFDYMGGEDLLREQAGSEAYTSFDEYKELVAKPNILQAKVHDYLLYNYQDVEGVEKIQKIYELLEEEDGANWDEVSEEYSDIYGEDDTVFLTEDELVDFFEPIKDLEVGEFSKIVQTPIAYIIWKLESINESEDGPIREIKAISIYTKSLDYFFNEFLNKTKIEKLY